MVAIIVKPIRGWLRGVADLRSITLDAYETAHDLGWFIRTSQVPSMEPNTNKQDINIPYQRIVGGFLARFAGVLRFRVWIGQTTFFLEDVLADPVALNTNLGRSLAGISRLPVF